MNMCLIVISYLLLGFLLISSFMDYFKKKWEIDYPNFLIYIVFVVFWPGFTLGFVLLIVSLYDFNELSKKFIEFFTFKRKNLE